MFDPPVRGAAPCWRLSAPSRACLCPECRPYGQGRGYVSQNAFWGQVVRHVRAGLIGGRRRVYRS